MIESAIAQLAKLKEEPENIIKSVEEEFDPAKVSWNSTRIRSRKMMDSEQARDDPALIASDQWKRETLYVAIDQISSGIRQRCQKSQPLLEAFWLFAPSRFPHLLLLYKTSSDLQKALEGFCQIVKLNCYRCADELFRFFTAFKKFILVF